VQMGRVLANLDLVELSASNAFASVIRGMNVRTEERAMKEFASARMDGVEQHVTFQNVCWVEPTRSFAADTVCV